MAGHLSLVESDFEKMEKRVLPRFPFCYLTFKDEKQSLVFEVKDISHTGAQLCLKDGEHNYNESESIEGKLCWNGEKLDIVGHIRWATKGRIGVEFSKKKELDQNVRNFLRLEQFAKAFKPIHDMGMDQMIPSNLKYWLKSDGPAELFVWTHSNGEFESFQFVIMEHFIEWVNGKGLETGRVFSKRDVDTPLIDTDEFVFKIDKNLEQNRIDIAKKIISNLNLNSMPSETINFIKLKLN